MLVKYVTKNLIDVFHGIGWDNWCRFEVNKGHLKMVGGNPLPNQIMQQLRKEIK